MAILSDVAKTFVSGLCGIITSMTMIRLGCQSVLKGGTKVDKMVGCGTRRGTEYKLHLFHLRMNPGQENSEGKWD